MTPTKVQATIFWGRGSRVNASLPREKYNPKSDSGKKVFIIDSATQIKLPSVMEYGLRVFPV